ncbi:phospholipid-transporting ATPase ABCA1-like isoform X2 [Patiria miniata]|uniref:ABC transporter domain-containing protein n=1 Tax=Patiria miniata TaxID=46514 RepID=A0A914B1E7_PATMI|nr:phospholipid-transporting ATPase ABCA1-like isoform X2 [Patiria miniata]
MAFFSQLKLLCWKNYTLRKRQKIRLLVEIIWPILMFMIIALVRRDELPSPHHECHFLSKALPSGGLLPFFQSFLCDFDSKCRPEETYGESIGHINNYGDAGLSKLVNDIETVLTNKTTMEALKKFLAKVDELNKLLPYMDDFNGIADSIPGSRSLINYLKDPDEVTRFLTNDLHLSPAVTQAILNSNVSAQEFLALTDPDTFQSASCDEAKLKQIFGVTNLTTLHEMQRELCNLTTADFASIAGVISKQIDLNKLLPLFTGGGNIPGSAFSLDQLKLLSDGLLQGSGLPLSYSLLTNKTALIVYLQQQMGLSEADARLIANSVDNPKMLMLYLQGHDMHSTVCNTTLLKDYVTTTDPEQLQELSTTLCNMSDTDLDKLSQEIRTLVNFTALWSSLNSTDMNKWYKETLQDMIDIGNEINELDSFQVLLTDIDSILNSNDTNELVCGSVGKMKDFNNFSLAEMSNSNSFQKLSSSPGLSHTSSSKPPKDVKNDTDGLREDCAWIQQIESSPFGKLAWKTMKPMVQGYILYTPDTKATQRIMKEAEQPLAAMEMFKNLTARWLEYSPTLRKYVEDTAAFDLANEFSQNPELVKKLEDQLQRNSTTDLVLIQKVLLQARSDSRDSGNFTQNLLNAIDALDEFANATMEILKCVNLKKMRGYSTDEEFQAAAKELQGDNLFWGAAVFEGFNTSAEDDTIPPHVVYQLRMDSSMVRSTDKYKKYFWKPGPMSDVYRYGEYIRGGFVFLQDMFDQGIIKASLGKKDAGAGAYIQEFPYPCYISDTFVQTLGAILPLLMIIAWLFSVAMIIKGIVLEKELRLKEVMKVMGMGNGVHWVAWFINSFIVMFISSCLLVLILKVGQITIQADASVLLLMLVSFSVSTIALCFLISTFFSKANLSAACGAVLFFLSYVPYSMVYSWDEFIPAGAKLAMCLSNTIAFGYASQYVALFEIQGTGLTWGTLGIVPNSSGEQMTPNQVITMMWLDAFLYMLLTWYIEAVFPGAYGMPRSWYFPFQRSYWCGSQIDTSEDADLLPMTSSNGIPTEDTDFEREPTHLKLGASIKNLYKVYRTGKKLAVNNLSINFYEGQITSFLGHNGAGKTTTMSILTGLFPPTAGTAYIYGKDILKDINRIRKSLGMCPQHNVLFDYLTVEEHLWFYARVKGATEEEIAVEMEEMLKHLNLPHKRKEMTANLSGGMKRKLSIAMAFVAGSKTVILDEPTAGVDPYARREIWDLLGRYKEGRTIIMSTHHMDEADVLGDRIAIISSGQLRCSGSSLFLKSRFGVGYYLVLNKRLPGDDVVIPPHLTDSTMYDAGLQNSGFSPMFGPDLVAGAMMNLPGDEKKKELDLDLVEPSQMKVALEPDDDDLRHKKDKPPVDIPDCGSCQESVLTSFIQSYVPGATLCENLGKELSYILPSGAIHGSALESLFQELEMYKERLYICDFGISDTSLEEVFLSVTDDSGVFNEGETLQSSDDGLLPRPFMGRGSLRRRSYQLPARSNSIRERRNRAQSTDGVALIDEDELDIVHQELEEDTHSMHSVNLNADNIDGTESAFAETDNQGSQEAGQNPEQNPEQNPGQNPGQQPGRQPIHARVKRQLSRQMSQRLLRQASREAVLNQQTNVTMSSVRMPDAESSSSRAADLSGSEVQGINLIRRQFYALMVKRFHHFRRSKKGFFAQVILPVVFVCVAMLFTVIMPPQTDTKKLPMVPWLTGTPNYVFYSNDMMGDELSAAMEASIAQDDPGIGTRCMADNPFAKDGFPCEPKLTGDWSTETMDPDLYEKYLDGELTCECSGKAFETCDEGAEGPPPPERSVPTTDVLQNYTGMNISWYIKTTTLDFIWQRFGGVSFLDTDDLAPLTPNISSELLADWDSTKVPSDVNLPGPVDDLLPTDITMDDIYSVMLSLARFKNMKVWWDNNGYHALPAFINVANNMLFRGNVEESKRDQYGISTYNYPINLTTDELQDMIMKELPISMSTAIFVVFALAFVPASFVVFLITERESKSKHLQIISGISPTTYWVSTLLWDLINYLIPAILTMLVFKCFNQKAFVSTEALPATVLLLLMYGWAITPMSYPASFFFSTPSTAYLSMACSNMLIGIVTIMTTFILEFLGMDDPNMLATNESLKQLFLIFPPFCLGEGLMKMSNVSLQAEVESKYENLLDIVSSPPNLLDWDLVGRNIFALGVTGVVFFALTLLIEHKFFFKPRLIKSEHVPLAHEDDDVVRERHRVLSGGAADDVVRVENLTKDFNTSRGICRAVDRMCVGIPRGECFGLLGVNGAGKTTTFRMLTGDTQVTSGCAYINGLSILQDMKRISHSVGYCPQFDALNELLTGEEHLAFYARLRGVPERDIKSVVDWGIKKLGLTTYAKRVAGTYSGGNKRKLSTAIALIGDPQLIFLDEPTTGMDPKARRFLWNRITSIIKEGRSIILTSHSMEECEALCTRVAIMVNGRFKCIGSTQHLKSKFGDGYTISIRVGGDPPRMEPLMCFVAEMFPHTVLRERHFNMLEYQMPTASTSLAKVFGVFGANKERFMIEDYSICQTTLDQVFINFAKEQKTGDEAVQEAEPTGVTVVNAPDSNQIVMSPELGSVQYVPTNSSVGGFAFATANIYGGVLHHDDPSGFNNPMYNQMAPPPTEAKPDGKGFTNPLYESSHNRVPSQQLNSNNSNAARGGRDVLRQPHPVPSEDGNKSDEDVLDDCLIPKQGQTLEQTPGHNLGHKAGHVPGQASGQTQGQTPGHTPEQTSGQPSSLEMLLRAQPEESALPFQPDAENESWA